MTLTTKERRDLARLSKKARDLRERANAASDEFVETMRDLRPRSTVRELAEVAGISFQRAHQLVTVRNLNTKAGKAGREQT